MSNIMTYKGFSARIEFDDDDGIFFGKIAGIDDTVGFHADAVVGLREAFREAVDDYIETCKRIGKAPEREFSGKVMLRVDPDLHAQIAKWAELSGKSLNAWGEQALRAAIRQPNDMAA